MTIYTRRGDTGQTRLLSGERVDKDHQRVKTYGALDELQSLIGLTRALCATEKTAAVLKKIQMDLFIICSELAAAQKGEMLKDRIGADDVTRLENQIDAISETCGMPSGFVIPGDDTNSAAAHVARTVCRRCERLLVALFRNEGGREILLAYINRLGDLLFMIAWELQVRSAIKVALADTLNEQGGRRC